MNPSLRKMRSQTALSALSSLNLLLKRRCSGGRDDCQLAGGTEVDFVLDDAAIAIGAKATAKVAADHLKGVRSIVREFCERLNACRFSM